MDVVRTMQEQLSRTTQETKSSNYLSGHTGLDQKQDYVLHRWEKKLTELCHLKYLGSFLHQR